MPGFERCAALFYCAGIAPMSYSFACGPVRRVIAVTNLTVEKFYGEKLNSICSGSSIAAGLLQNFGSILLKSFS
jgi:hypothetical protein